MSTLSGIPSTYIEITASQYDTYSYLFTNPTFISLNPAATPSGKRSAERITVLQTALVRSPEALVMALIGVLRWREENNVRASVTGASRDSIGGAVWIGQEA